MTKVSIKPFLGGTISDLISSTTGLKLDSNKLGILHFCQLMGETWTGYVDGRLVCCWGLIAPSMLSNQAYLWMYTTDAVRDHQFLLVRHSQKVIEGALRDYEVIVGHCLVDAKDSIRWLKWLGATFGEPDGHAIPFAIRRRSNG